MVPEALLVEDALAENNDDLGAVVARYVAAFTYEDIGVETVAAVKSLTLDCLGAGVAAVGEPGCVEIRALVEGWGGTKQSTIFGSGTQVPIHAAVAANSTMCRALDFDDVSETALLHASATIVPVALACAEASSAPVSGRDLVAAIALGIDVANRLSLAPTLNNSGPGYRPRGMSFTYQIGTMAAAVVVARLARASSGAVLAAIGMAYSNAAGNQQAIADNTLAVRVQQGLSASNGVVAAQVALRGVPGPHHPLEGRFGYYPTYCQGAYDRTRVLDGLGERLTVLDVSIKPYPCCKYTHTAIAATLKVREDPRFAIDRLERVVVRVDNAEYYSLVCDPIETKRRPQTVIEAQFSMAYTVAVALVRGGVRLDDFRQGAVIDPIVGEVCQKVECIMGPTASLGRRLPTPGHVEVHLNDRTVLVGDADYAPGHPLQRFSWDETVEKFLTCARFPDRLLPVAQSEAIVQRIANLETAGDVRDLVSANLVWAFRD